MQTRTLPVKLTADEIALKARELGQKISEHDQLEADKKSASDGFKTRIELADDAIRALGRVVRDGKEYREVEVEERRDEHAKTIETYRLDLGERIDVRPMTRDELQAELFPIEGGGKKRGRAAAASTGTSDT